MLERRNFLTALSATMVTAMLPAGVLAATPGKADWFGRTSSLRDRFAPLIGNDFRLVDEAGVRHRARLVALDDDLCSPELEQFSIVFEGSGLTDGLYEVYHPSTGTLRIGLMSSGEPGSPVGRQRAHFSNFV
jgi:hypothetical protein